MNNILLDLLTFTSVLSAILVITARSPIIAILFLIAVFINTAGYLILLGINFIALSYIMLYIGAIAILFLFVIMMLNIRLVELDQIGNEYNKNIPLGIIIAALLGYEIISNSLTQSTDRVYLITSLFDKLNYWFAGVETSNNYLNVAFNQVYSNIFVNYEQIETLGSIFYTNYSLYLILCSFVLLLAMIGPIIITLDKKTSNSHNTKIMRTISVELFRSQSRGYHTSSINLEAGGNINLGLQWLINAPEGTPAKIYLNSKESKPKIYQDNRGQSGIYMWFNNLSGKFYVGSAVDLSRRLKYYYSPKELTKANNLIHKALMKYGHENFSLYILEYCPIEELIIREQYYFNLLIPSYNILKIAGNSLGFKHSEETKLKMSQIKLNNLEFISKLKELGYNNKGTIRTEEFKTKLRSLFLGENNPMFGKTHTETTKLAMSLAKKGLYSGPNNPMYGRVHKKESLIKISEKTSKKVYVYSKDNLMELVQEFNSQKQAVTYFNSSRATISRYVDSNKIYKDKWILSSTLLS